MHYAIIRLIGAVILTCVLLVAAACWLGGALPDGGQIAYASARDRSLDIYLLDMRRDMRLNLTRSAANEQQPDWSPDGLHIAYVSDVNGGRDIFVQAVGCANAWTVCGGDKQQVTFASANDFSPAWSPDGRYLAYMSEAFFDLEIAVIDLGNGDLTPIRLTYRTGLDADPAWSPDGKRLAFISDRESPFDADIYLMDSGCISAPKTCDATVERLLTSLDQQLLPAWSPDGRRIVFTTTRNVFRQMAVVEVDAPETPRLLLDGQGGDDTPAWSADGQSIVFMSYRDNRAGDLYQLWVDCEGGADDCLQRLTNDPAFDLSPRWRPSP